MSKQEIEVCPKCENRDMSERIERRSKGVFLIPICSECGWEGEQEDLKIIRENIDYRNKKIKCSCGVLEGSYHNSRCDYEVCPFCDGNLYNCYCHYEKLGYDLSNLPSDIFENGLSQEDWKKWDSILKERVRITFIKFPILCAICGVIYPHLFLDEDWEENTYPKFHKDILCLSCYEKVVKLGIKNFEHSELCLYCGISNPIQDAQIRKEINQYIDPQMRDSPICKECCVHIRKKLIENNIIS